MKLHDIYQKKIDRSIEGVIKADDAQSLLVEVEEYVLTKEVSQRLGDFLDSYNNPNNANGVWISGFFGSGKSHLLKILSLLLENREIEGQKLLNIFLPKCDDEVLKAELRKATTIPSQSILFNIDQKADVISKTEIDALLSVFVKVFDEMCGYYGKQPHIAQFERDLESRNQYEKFKDRFSIIAGKDWEIGREQTILEGSNIAKAYSAVLDGKEEEYKDILTKYRNEYKLSIEDFATQVWNYIQTKQKNFRLNFFVDEVGQYIADNIKLMTNLQTLAESLSTKCRGQAWIIVTAQEDMNNVVGEMNKQQANDFSKIQARFSNKMKLTSQDVAEVIQKRLLAKTREATIALSQIYLRHANDFKTLFDFADGAQTYRNYRDQEHFIDSYPFIPYQFTLFQSAIQQISNHNGFEGKHSSVGERSMLGVFQESAKHLADKEIGTLATFDLMFEGIKTALKSHFQQSIFKAERNLTDDFAVRVLKILFLVKYVKEFKPTIRNICVLMHDSIDRDLPQLKKQVEESLNLLEQQTYIQRNGNLYEFLTDEEKDVEQEIKNTDVDPDAEAGELAKIIFDDILKERKICYDKNGQSYSFSRKLDNSLNGNRDYELTIHIISPFYEHADNLHILRSHNLGRDELMVILAANTRLPRDLEMYLKTEKYIQQNTKTAQSESTKRILFDKRDQNSFRKLEIQKTIKALLSQATLLAHGNNLEITATDPQARIVLGFQELIATTYPQLKILRDITYKETQIQQFLNPANSLFTEDVIVLDEAEQEILSYVQMQQKTGVRTTIKSLTEKFEKKPYGWYLAAIQCIVAKLNTRGKIECQLDSYTLENKELESALRNTQAHGNIVLKPQQEFSAAQLRQLKEFFEEFFNASPSAGEAKALGLEISEELKKKLANLKVLAAQRHEFPFLAMLDKAIERIQSLAGKSYDFYIKEMGSFEDDLLNLKADLIEPIETFMRGEKKRIYTDACDFLQKHEYDFSYVDGTESTELSQICSSMDCYRGDKIRRAKELHQSLEAKINKNLNILHESKQKDLERLKSKITGAEEFSQLNTSAQREFLHEFEIISTRMHGLDSIPVIESTFNRFEGTTYKELLYKLEALEKPIKDGVVEEPKTEIIQACRVTIHYTKLLLSSEADVEDYLNEYKKALMQEIKSGKKVQV